MPPPYLREHLLERERAWLAPYATFTADSRGRRHPEPVHALRGDFQRDRDRIIHSRAFRRLEYKTQVFVHGLNDHFRTRLTHTIEVAGITRTVARVLGLNEDLAEAIALAHDLGHPPFGHCGERGLNNLLVEHGGFDHNRQALRVVDELEEKYPDFCGLNLTWEVRSGLVKHRHATPPTTLDGQPLPPVASLEAQVANAADDLTYFGHDLDDGIGAGLLHDAELRGVDIWRRALARAGHPVFVADDERYYPFIVRHVIDLLVEDLVTASAARLAAAALPGAEAAQRLPTPLIDFSASVQAACVELREFLFKNLYWHRAVLDDNELAVTHICALYAFLLAHPADLGRRARRRLGADGPHRAVADYIANMTDRYALAEYARLVRDGGNAECRMPNESG